MCNVALCSCRHIFDVFPADAACTLNHNMNSASGIGASQELVDTFAGAVESGDVRIIKVSIKNG